MTADQAGMEKPAPLAEVSSARARSHQSPGASFRRLSLKLCYGFSSTSFQDECSKVLGAFCIDMAQQGQPKDTFQSSQGLG